MSERIVNTEKAKRLVETTQTYGAAIIGQRGGWSVLLRLGNSKKFLGTQRAGRLRLWRSLDRCVKYLRSEFQIVHFDFLDASNHIDAIAGGKICTDTAKEIHKIRKAAAYDKWFHAQVTQAIKEADDPNTQWVSHEDVKASWEKKRVEFRKRIAEKTHLARRKKAGP